MNLNLNIEFLSDLQQTAFESGLEMVKIETYNTCVGL